MENLVSQSCPFFQAVLLCGRKFIDEGHSSSDEIKARCDQLQENWDELKNLAEQRCVRVSLLVQFLESLNIYSLLGLIVACYPYFIVAVVNLPCSN